MLRAHKHLTKKELKKDPFLIFIAQATEYIQDEWMKIGGVVVVVALVIAAFNFIVSSQTSSDINDYNRAIAAYYANAPEAMDLLNQYVEKHQNSKRARRVMLQLANTSLTDGNYQAAAEYYQQCADNLDDDQILAFNALNGLGAVREELGQYEEAAQAYEQFLTSFQNSPFNSMMRLNAAKAYYLAGNTASARDQFRQLTGEDVEDTIYQEAMFYLELIS